jgi:predicted RNA methylase
MESKKKNKYPFKQYLWDIEEFGNPKVYLEQYITPPDITLTLFQLLNVILT